MDKRATPKSSAGFRVMVALWIIFMAHWMFMRYLRMRRTAPQVSAKDPHSPRDLVRLSDGPAQ
jgi:ABC-type nickel/cobalt efflux system permease component RcnA